MRKAVPDPRINARKEAARGRFGNSPKLVLLGNDREPVFQEPCRPLNRLRATVAVKHPKEAHA
eukprot:6687349-Alexandrium_andersonii.AAC.1